MQFKFATESSFARDLRKKWLSATILIILVTAIGYGQTVLTKDQFARLSLLSRARYFETEILNAARSEGVDPNILWTIAYNETRFRPWLRSPKNAQGLMQFIPSTASRFDLVNPYSSSAAIWAAARYVRVLSNLFGGRLDSILAAYNSGEGTVLAYITGRTIKTERKIINPRGYKTIGGVPPYNETIGYVGRGLKLYRWLIARGIFPLNSVNANLPSVISQSVAQVKLFDVELGKVPDYKTKTISLPEIEANRSDRKETLTSELPPEEIKAPRINSLQEVYYDSRSGSRYTVNNGNQTKLTENGVIVISTTTRPPTTNKARSTFFAIPIK
ncbi:MAG TPA: lytic transglycosylase domain-containing protein [Pyrinomonadaceae bacterium]|nr:lytic transglycosylase domain-containing protein [Pyrinomonadaceae bacterium]